MHESALAAIHYDPDGLPLPPTCIPTGSRRRIALIGWLDRFRYRRVTDDKRTHFTLRLAAQYSGGCDAVELWRHVRSTTLSTERAALAHALEQSPEPAPPDPGTPDAAGHGRLAWAARVRESHDHAARTRRAAANAESAGRRLMQIDAELHALPERAEYAVGRWASDLAERLAIYGRARNGSVGREAATDADLPIALPTRIRAIDTR